MNNTSIPTLLPFFIEFFDSFCFGIYNRSQMKPWILFARVVPQQRNLTYRGQDPIMLLELPLSAGTTFNENISFAWILLDELKKKFEVGSIISIVYFSRLVSQNLRERDIFRTEFRAQKWKLKPSADPFMQSNRLVLQAFSYETFFFSDFWSIVEVSLSA